MNRTTTTFRRSISIAMFGFASLAFAAPALAALPPLPEDQLAARSDLIVDARVTKIACAAPVQRAAGAGVLIERPFISTLEVLATHKGQAGANLSYRGFDLDSPAGWTGPQPSRPLPVGWTGKLHLKSRGDGVYEQTYTGNDVAEDRSRSQPQPLPTCPKTVTAPDDSAGDDDEHGGCSYSGGSPAGSGASLLAGLMLALASGLRRRRS